MPKPKTIIVYESYHHHNTETIARVIAQRLQADLYKPEQVNLSKLSDYEALGIGTGIYFSKPHEKIQSFLNSIPNLTGLKGFIFTTSGSINQIYIQGIKTKNISAMEQKGLQIIDYFFTKGWDTLGPFKLLGGINKGHPDLDDLYKAELFANKILNTLKSKI